MRRGSRSDVFGRKRVLSCRLRTARDRFRMSVRVSDPVAVVDSPAILINEFFGGVASGDKSLCMRRQGEIVLQRKPTNAPSSLST